MLPWRGPARKATPTPAVDAAAAEPTSEPPPALYLSLLHATPDRLAVLDSQGVVLCCSPAWEAFAPGRPGLRVGDNYADYLAAGLESTERVGNVCRRGLKSVLQGEAPGFELDYPTCGAALKWFHLSIKPEPDFADLFLVRHREVTPQRFAEDQLKAAQRFQQVILDHAGYAMIVTTATGVITTFNPAAERMLGLTADEVLGRRNLLSLHVPEEIGPLTQEAAPNLEAILGLAQAEEGAEREWTWVRKDGTRVPVLLSVTALRAEGDLLTGFVAMAVDIGGRKKIEAQLSQAQRLESIGQLAAGIAHEINTPMQFVSDNVEFLETCFQTLCEVTDELDAQLQGPPADWAARKARIGAIYQRSGFVKLRSMIQGAIGDCRDGCERIVSIVRAMRQLSHPGHAGHERADLNELIRSACTISRNRWKYSAEVRLTLDAHLPPVKCRVAEISQVILNLVVNAADAIAERLGDRPEQKGEIHVRTESTGDQVMIRISDTGCGIPEAIRERIFDPFFTTKPVGKGTGQGLSIAYDAVVNKHRGTIQVFSEVGQGTMFVVALPVDLPSGPLSGMWQVGGHHESKIHVQMGQSHAPAGPPTDTDDLIG